VEEQERTKDLALLEEPNGEVAAGEWRKKGEVVAEKRLSQSLMSSKLIVRVSIRTEPKDLSLSAQANRMGQSAWDPWRSIFMMRPLVEAEL